MTTTVWVGSNSITGQPLIMFDNRDAASKWVQLDPGHRTCRAWGTWPSYDTWAQTMHQGNPPTTTPTR